MTNRKKIAAGNWKMHKTLQEAQGLVHEIRTMAETELMNQAEILVFPPFIHLTTLVKQTAGSNIKIGAQNMHQNEQGAFTGEISAPMLKSIQVEYVLIGHSERRQYFNETTTSCREKINKALIHGLKPVYCIGETFEERNQGNHFAVVEEQLNALADVQAENFSKIIIAYEPVWAIGTGLTASSDQANEMHIHIRKVVSEILNAEFAEKVSILYGGSVKPDNAQSLFAMSDIDGALIGGAALNSRDFIDIAKSF
jgi:triosephosphate isomerase